MFPLKRNRDILYLICCVSIYGFIGVNIEFHVENGQSKYRLRSSKDDCRLSDKCNSHKVYH